MLNKLLLKSKNTKNEQQNSQARSSECPSTGANSTQGIVTSQKGSIASSSVNSIANIQSLTSSLSAANPNTSMVKSQSNTFMSSSITRQMSPTHAKDIEKLNLRAQTQIPQSKQRNHQSSRSSLKHNSSTDSEQIFTPKTSSNKQKTTDSAKSTIQRVAVNLNTLDEFANDPVRRVGQIRESQVKGATDSSRKGSVSYRNGATTHSSSSVQSEYKKILGFDHKESSSVMAQSEFELQQQQKNDLNLLSSSLHEAGSSSSSQKQSFYKDLKWNFSNRGRFDTSAVTSAAASAATVQTVSVTTIQDPSGLSASAVVQLIQDNKKMKLQLEFAQKETHHWRSKYEELYKHHDNEHERTKESFESEIQSLNGQIQKLKQNQLGSSSQLNRSSNQTRASPFNRGVLKENVQSQSIQQQNQQANSGTSAIDDWQANYNKLKEEKEKNEKSLKKRIESLEEQNAFLQLESIEARKNQRTEPIVASGKPSISESPFQEQKPTEIHKRSSKTNNLKDLTSYFTSNLS